MDDYLKAAYVETLDDIIAQFLELGDSSIRLAIDAMQRLLDEIARELLSVPEPDAFHIQGVINRLEDDIAQYQASLTTITTQAGVRATSLGALLIVEPINVLGLEMTWVSTNPLASIVTEYTADLIGGITQEMLTKINASLRLSAMGALSPYQVMQRVTRILGLAEDKITGIAYKSEELIRTELTRIFNMAAQAQQFATAQQVAGLQKSWMAVGDWRTRLHHLMAHLRYSQAPIPVEEPFMVGEDFMMYPGDPSGSPSELINCRCISVAIHPLIGYIETPLDFEIQAELARR